MTEEYWKLAESSKTQGNTLFKTGKYLDALRYYDEALKIVEKLVTKAKLNKDNEELILTLHTNKAACYLKLENYKGCVEECTSVLDLNPASVKALYRRASALERMNEFPGAYDDLKLLLSLDHGNNDAIKLMRKVKEDMVKKSATRNECIQIIEARKASKLSAVAAAQSLIDLCADDAHHALQFGKSLGLTFLSTELNELVDRHEFPAVSLYLRFINTLINHKYFYDQFVYIGKTQPKSNDDSSLIDAETGKLCIYSVTMFVIKCNEKQVFKVGIILVMNILKHAPITVEPIQESMESADQYQLLVNKDLCVLILDMIVVGLQIEDVESFQLLCDAFGALISDIPDYHQEAINHPSSSESTADRKRRGLTRALVNNRSKLFAKIAVEKGFLNLFIERLENNSLVIRQNAISSIGKLIKYLDDEQCIKDQITKCNLLIEDLAPSNCVELDEEFYANLTKYKLRARIEVALFTTHPELGSWLFCMDGGVVQLLVLIQTRDLKNCELATEVLCLAANLDSCCGLLERLVAHQIFHDLLNSKSSNVRAAAASTLAKLSIKAKAIGQDSAENVGILNAVASILKDNSTTVATDSLDSPYQATLERAVEVLAAMVGNSKIKDEIVHGSNRVISVIKFLSQLQIDGRSPAAYGLAYIFATLTVTNRELRALALAEKDISVDQYEKIMELQRIKAKDEAGDPLEEPKDETDEDSAELCKLRIRKIVTCDGIKTLVRLANSGSKQTVHIAVRSLRQICTDELSRGAFIQQGALKLCVSVAIDEAVELTTRLEAAHAVGKALVTTNPNLLSEHLRLSTFRPLLFACRESSSHPLTVFESLLSITNLLSCGQVEQDRFVSENGVQIVHYLMFSENLMVRRAATECFCNVSSHEGLLKVLRSSEKLKLWLGLCEEWDEDIQSPEYLTARAASGTLAVAASDIDVCFSLCASNCVNTVISLMSSEREELIHRSLVIMLEMISHENRDIVSHFTSSQILDTLSGLSTNENPTIQQLLAEILRSFSEIVKN